MLKILNSNLQMHISEITSLMNLLGKDKEDIIKTYTLQGIALFLEEEKKIIYKKTKKGSKIEVVYNDQNPSVEYSLIVEPDKFIMTLKDKTYSVIDYDGDVVITIPEAKRIKEI